MLGWVICQACEKAGKKLGELLSQGLKVEFEDPKTGKVYIETFTSKGKK
jgi:hypothetical protein